MTSRSRRRLDRPQHAIVVERDCSDEVMRKTLANHVNGWDKLRAEQKTEWAGKRFNYCNAFYL